MGGFQTGDKIQPNYLENFWPQKEQLEKKILLLKVKGGRTPYNGFMYDFLPFERRPPVRWLEILSLSLIDENFLWKCLRCCVCFRWCRKRRSNSYEQIDWKALDMNTRSENFKVKDL